MDYSKVTESDKVVALLIQRRRIEKEIMKIDDKALINYELEKLAEPQANEDKTSTESDVCPYDRSPDDCIRKADTCFNCLPIE